MGKHYCDYCDVFLTHDSSSVRRDHNTGRNHLQNVRDYYQSLDPAQNEGIYLNVLREYDLRGLPHPVFTYVQPQQNFGGGGYGGRPPFQQNRPPYGGGFQRPPPMMGYQQQGPPPSNMYGRPPPPMNGVQPLGMARPGNFNVPPPGYGPR